MNPQLILLGAPGSGKGTQAKELVMSLEYNHLSTGDLLRTEIEKKSDLGNRVAAIMDAGDLVADDIVLELLKANCDLNSSHYIFDGFPRNIEQAKALDAVVLGDCPKLAIYFDINLGVLLERIVNRRTCSKCGEIYNLISKSPKVDGKCDSCDGSLIHRKDDNKSTVENRLEVYKSAIDPVLEYYESQNKLVRLDASKNSSEIFDQLKESLKS